MKMERATKKQRIFSWLIDAIIVGGIGFLIGFFISKATGVNSWVDSLYSNYLTNLKNGTDSLQDLTDLLVAYMARIGIYSSIYLVLVIIYLVIIPYFVSWQTVGRLITKCKLVMLYEGTKPRLKNLIIREVLGEFIIYIVLTLIFFAWNLLFWFSSLKAIMKNASFPDRMSKLKLVDKDAIFEEVNENFESEDFQYDENYDWEKEDNNLTDETQVKE